MYHTVALLGSHVPLNPVLSYRTTFVPGGYNRFHLKSNLPLRCASAEIFVFILDVLRRLKKFWPAQ